MTASAGTPRQAAVAFPPIPLRKRIYGFGSIYGKSVRDSRLSFIIAAGLLGGMALIMGAAVSNIFPTTAARLEVDALFGGIPKAMMRLFGNVDLIGTKVGTLGGYITFKYSAIFALGTAIWSIMALSGTLAGEAARGSLDFVAVTTFGKQRIAIEKLAAHLTLLWLAMAVLAVMTTFSSTTFGNEALGDHIPLLSSAGFALWVGLTAMLFGGLAFALAPILGRAGSAGLSGLLMAALWFANGMNVGGPFLLLSPFNWTFNHVPLVGAYDWPSLALLAVFAVVFLAVGVVLFARRDLGVTAGLSLPGIPAAVLGVRGPVSRAFGDQLPRAVSWGVGLGLLGVLYASLAGSLTTQIAGSAGLEDSFARIFPTADFKSIGGWMQFYAELLFIGTGFAAATFVSRWASDEGEGRLEMALTSPLARARWVAAGGAAALLAIVMMTVVFAAGIAIGSSIGGLTSSDAVIGCASLGLYAAAIVGVGFAVGGLWRTSIAAEIAALVVVVTYLLDLVVPALNLPDWLHQLALTTHFGKPMIGEWDVVGVAACLVIAVAGIGIGALGMTRRDIAR